MTTSAERAREPTVSGQTCIERERGGVEGGLQKQRLPMAAHFRQFGRLRGSKWCKHHE